MSKLEFFSSNLGQRFFWGGYPPRNIQQWDFQCKTLIQNVFYVTDLCVVKYPREKVTRFWAFKPHPGGIFREKDGRRAKRAFVQLFIKIWFQRLSTKTMSQAMSSCWNVGTTCSWSLGKKVPRTERPVAGRVKRLV